jgi:hypothetical protein
MLHTTKLNCTRNVVERYFGVSKQDWRILYRMLSYLMVLMMIVAATMCLHNFNRENHVEDKHFLKCDRNPYYMPTILKRYRRHRISQALGDTSSAADDDRMMDRFRDDLRRAIYISRSP